MEVEIRFVRGHVEVFDLTGRFLFSADTEQEAREELAGRVTGRTSQQSIPKGKRRPGRRSRGAPIPLPSCTLRGVLRPFLWPPRVPVPPTPAQWPAGHFRSP